MSPERCSSQAAVALIFHCLSPMTSIVHAGLAILSEVIVT